MKRRTESSVRWTWPNAAARVAQPVTRSSIGDIGYQQDIARWYRLMGVGTTRWGQMPDPSLGPPKYATAQRGTTTIAQVGIGMSVTVGPGAAARSPSGATKSTNLDRVSIPTSAVAGNIGVFRNNASPGLPSVVGVRYQMRATLGAVGGSAVRWCMGITSSAPGATANPNTFLNGVWIGRESGSNLQLFNNDGAGTATTTDLGASFPGATVNTGYGLEIFSLDGSSYVYQVHLIDNPLIAVSGTISTDIPANSTALLVLLFVDNNTDAAASSIDFADLTIGQLAA